MKRLLFASCLLFTVGCSDAKFHEYNVQQISKEGTKKYVITANDWYIQNFGGRFNTENGPIYLPGELTVFPKGSVVYVP